MDRKLLFVLIVVVAILLGIVVIYYSYVSLPSPSTEEGPPQILGHISHLYSSGSVTFLVVEGVIQNDLNTNAQINVTATFYDAQNDELGELWRANVLKSRQKSPFTFYWPVNSSETRYELDLAYARTSEQPVDSLEVVNLTNQTENEQFLIRGEVWNRGSLKAFSVAVVCACYNAQGNLSALPRIFIPSVEAGGTSLFEISIDASESPANYDLMVSAANYEDLSIANTVLFVLLVLILLGFVIFMKRRGW